MRRALLLAAALGLSGCAQQDAALLVTFSGGYRIPTDADKLIIDVYDGTTDIKHLSYALTAQTSWPGSVTLVQSGAQHPHVKINAQLSLQNVAVGVGTAQADFQSGRTVNVAITLVPPP